jgi:glucose-6-phosphate isomerase
MLKRYHVHLSLYRDTPPSERYARTFEQENVLERLKSIDRVARRKGLAALDAKNRLVALGTEVNEQGSVTKNSYGVLNLSWQVPGHPEWPQLVLAELDEIREGIRKAHGMPLQFLIWAGMGGSAEDKSMYNAVGLLKRSPRCYVLDSTDPAKLKAILDDIQKRSGGSLARALKSTLVVGMAMGMTSYEPVVNLEKLAQLYEKSKIDSKSNFIYMTLPGSLLDRFAARRGYRRVELQLDNENSTAGRHSAPLTRGSLYPLGLAKVNLEEWIENTILTDEEIGIAWQTAAFLHAQGEAGRDKVALLLPKQWAGAALWTKQDFEESLGKSEECGIKVVIGEKVKMANYRPPKDPLQDRVFLVVQMKGATDPAGQKLRRAGYPVGILTLDSKTVLSRYLQFIHYVVFGLGNLRGMNFVTQPSVELYKAITNRLHADAQKSGGIEKSAAWQKMAGSPKQVRWKGGVTLHYDQLPFDVDTSTRTAPAVYAEIIRRLFETRCVEYAELTFFGDMRYSPHARSVRKALDRAADVLYRSRLKCPADVYEGPAMNHSYHEMIIGHGKCLSTVLLSLKSEKIPAADYTADYHRAQFLATQLALAERNRYVVAITLKDLEDGTLSALDELFRETAALLKSFKI